MATVMHVHMQQRRNIASPCISLEQNVRSTLQTVAGVVSLRVNQLDVKCETKTRDNVRAYRMMYHS